VRATALSRLTNRLDTALGDKGGLWQLPWGGALLWSSRGSATVGDRRVDASLSQDPPW